jgi:hypothetical protein
MKNVPDHLPWNIWNFLTLWPYRFFFTGSKVGFVGRGDFWWVIMGKGDGRVGLGGEGVFEF